MTDTRKVQAKFIEAGANVQNPASGQWELVRRTIRTQNAHTNAMRFMCVSGRAFQVAADTEIEVR